MAEPSPPWWLSSPASSPASSSRPPASAGPSAPPALAVPVARLVADQPIAQHELPPGRPSAAVTHEPTDPAHPPHATLAALLLADGRFPAGGHAHSAGAEAACADGRIVDEASLAAFVGGRLRTTGLVDAAMAAATTLLLGSCATEVDVRAALAALDAEADARIAAPPLRAASRRLGRQLVRVAARCWPDATLALVPDALPDGAHQPVALGAVGVAAGLDAAGVARLSVHHAVTTPAQATVRLLGLDPFGVAAVSAQLTPLAEDVAAQALAAAHTAVAVAVGGRPEGPSAAGARSAASGPVETAVAVHPEDQPDAVAGPGPAPATSATTRGPRSGRLLDPAALADLPALSGQLVEIAAIEHRDWDVRMFAT